MFLKERIPCCMSDAREVCEETVDADAQKCLDFSRQITQEIRIRPYSEIDRQKSILRAERPAMDNQSFFVGVTHQRGGRQQMIFGVARKDEVQIYSNSNRIGCDFP